MESSAPIFTITSKRITITYARAICDSRRRLLAFPPVQRGSQCVDQLVWTCDPPAQAQREKIDEFGNRALELYHARLPRQLSFAMTLVSRRHNQTVPRSVGLPAAGLGGYLLPSALADGAESIRELVRGMGRPSGSQRVDEISAEVCGVAHGALRYRWGSTHVGTTASQALAKGEGVCQDYAHLMIALCRAAGLAARYVSGYNPTEGAMHAWVEVLCGEEWHAWDPTHNRPTSGTCVFVACGRDFRDVAPVQGSYLGQARAQLSVHCRTRVVDQSL